MCCAYRVRFCIEIQLEFNNGCRISIFPLNKHDPLPWTAVLQTDPVSAAGASARGLWQPFRPGSYRSPSGHPSPQRRQWPDPLLCWSPAETQQNTTWFHNKLSMCVDPYLERKAVMTWQRKLFLVLMTISWECANTNAATRGSYLVSNTVSIPGYDYCLFVWYSNFPKTTL